MYVGDNLMLQDIVWDLEKVFKNVLGALDSKVS